MLRLICPKCHRNSYSISVESFTPCPYCGYVYSGKYGAEKRDEVRIEKDMPFIFSFQGQNLEASTVDFSEKGLGIEILGDPPVAVDDTINIFIRDLRVRATVMWVRRLADKSLAGLRRLN